MARTRTRKLRWLLLLLFAAALFLYYVYGGRDLFSLQTLKITHDFLAEQVHAAPVLSAGAYVIFYATLVALALPASGLMMLAGGALFGWWRGALLATIGSTIGATLAMLGARILLRNWIQRRWPDMVARIDLGIERHGGAYLVSLRLAPAVPFLLINLSIGLTAMPVRRFALLTAISGIPGAIVFAYAGQTLTRVQNIHDVLSPTMIGLLLGLAILPWVAKLFGRRMN